MSEWPRVTQEIMAEMPDDCRRCFRLELEAQKIARQLGGDVAANEAVVDQATATAQLRENVAVHCTGLLQRAGQCFPQPPECQHDQLTALRRR